MPCNDVTELIEVVLDAEDRLKEYTFAKRSCGRAIGSESLLIDMLEGRGLEELLRITAQDFLDEFPMADETEEFLSLKHLFAIQGALEVLTGHEPGRREDPFAASGIVYGPDETRIKGRISLDLVIAKIEACGNCGSCGSEKVESGRAENARRRAERETAQSN